MRVCYLCIVIHGTIIPDTVLFSSKPRVAWGNNSMMLLVPLAGRPPDLIDRHPDLTTWLSLSLSLERGRVVGFPRGRVLKDSLIQHNPHYCQSCLDNFFRGLFHKNNTRCMATRYLQNSRSRPSLFPL